MPRKSKPAETGSDKIRKPKVRSTSTRRTASRKRPLPRVDLPEPTAVDFDPTNQAIQTRAYFISERRRRFDLPGDANSDWLEAKRQLLSETRH